MKKLGKEQIYTRSIMTAKEKSVIIRYRKR